MVSSIQKSGLPHTDYYAPSFRVEIDGEQLSPQTNGDVLSLKVSMDIDNMTSFEICVANWVDAATPRTAETLDGFKHSDSNRFDPGRQVHIKMGYADRLVSMVTGQITSLAPKFPQQGPSTLTVAGLDGMFRLKDRRPREGEATKYRNKTDSQIAEIIATRNNLLANVTPGGESHPEVVQKNQDDAQFLIERAKRIDFDCFLLTDPQSNRTTLHFMRPTDGRDSSRIRNFALRWGENLISFMPTINMSEQVGQVTVRGWNPTAKQAIVATAGPDDLPRSASGGRSGPQASQQSQQKSDVTVDAPVSSQQEAFELAKSLLLERAYRYITATGQIIGLPDLRPSDNLSLSGLGSRFNGDYYVKKVEHTVGESGYQTQFEARRMYEGSLRGATR
jgi:Bacteriophage probable baseplate hub protein